MNGGTIALGMLAYYTIETIITYTVIDQLRNMDLEDNSIRTKMPENKPKIKLKF